MKTGWLTLRATAARLGMTCYRINRIAARGVIRSRVSVLSGNLEFNQEDIEKLAETLASV